MEFLNTGMTDFFILTRRLFAFAFFHRIAGVFPGVGAPYKGEGVFCSFFEHFRYQTGTGVFIRSGTVDDDLFA